MRNLAYALWMEADYQRSWAEYNSRETYLLFTHDLRLGLFGGVE